MDKTDSGLLGLSPSNLVSNPSSYLCIPCIPWDAEDAVQVLGSLPLIWETWIEFQTSDFGLAQLYLSICLHSPSVSQLFNNVIKRTKHYSIPLHS